MTNREQPDEVQLDVYVRVRMRTPVAMETVVYCVSPTQLNGRASGDCRCIMRDDALIGSLMGLSDEAPETSPYHGRLMPVSGGVLPFSGRDLS